LVVLAPDTLARNGRGGSEVKQIKDHRSESEWIITQSFDIGIELSIGDSCRTSFQVLSIILCQFPFLSRPLSNKLFTKLLQELRLLAGHLFQVRCELCLRLPSKPRTSVSELFSTRFLETLAGLSVIEMRFERTLMSWHDTCSIIDFGGKGHRHVQLLELLEGHSVICGGFEVGDMFIGIEGVQPDHRSR
jgi:hypothetical protein